MKVVVIISADAEWEQACALLPGLAIERSPFGELAVTTVEGRQVILLQGGWGKISAAASAQYVIDTLRPDLLVNLGTCGGFAGRVEVGTILLVERTVVYDILEQMGDGAEAIGHYSTLLDLEWLPRPLPHPAMRGLLVSADRDLTAQDIPMLIEQYGAAAADWESGAIAWVAKRNKIACLILRGVSDLVGSEGGEAYGKLELFHARTRVIMKELLAQLPDWVAAAEEGLAAREQATGRGQSD